MWRLIRRSLSTVPREVIDCDVCIVGGGPSGLAAAIKLKQINAGLEVCLLEKAAEVGAHILSGNLFEPRALDELIPDWRTMETPITTPVSEDQVFIFTETSALQVPNFLLPKTMHNEGNYVVSLSQVCKWLGSYAEELGVQVYPGFAAAEVIYSDSGFVTGVATGDFGIGKNGQPKDNFQRGIEIKAKQTIFAEGCRGSLSEQLISRFKLRDNDENGRKVEPQTYGIGLKEVWEVQPHVFKAGLAIHSANWPPRPDSYGGGFVYHMEPNLVHVGMVIALDYTDPYLNPYKELQRYKTHPKVKQYLEGGDCVAYGARAVNEGGYNALPKLTFPGGALVGCSAGFLNVAKIKGTHTAMKSGMMAAEAVAEEVLKGHAEGVEPSKYQYLYKNSWVNSR
jgi:electron-transferring-flavoprotein dehydrogenase